MKIGLIDSGIGGIKVLESLQKVHCGEYLYVFDKSGMPYGNKSSNEIKSRIFYLCDFLIKRGVEMVVLACNTASCVALEDCRERYSIPILGLIPPIESFDEGSRVLLLSTELTAKILQSRVNYSNIILAPQKELAQFIENNLSNKVAIDNYIEHNIMIYKNMCDKVFLGCTHYYYIKNSLQEKMGVKVIDGRESLASEFASLVNKNLVSEKSVTEFFYF